MRVCLDPGHGGYDPGAVGPGGLKEKDVARAVATHYSLVLAPTPPPVPRLVINNRAVVGVLLQIIERAGPGWSCGLLSWPAGARSGGIRGRRHSWYI
ncbi:N-acetylmuramoyl-L-alanine amidase family protein [Thermodesulfitimonas sp.]